MERRGEGSWFKQPGIAQITLDPNSPEFQSNEAWDLTRVYLTKMPYVLLIGLSHHVSTVIYFAERIEKVLNEGQKICVDVSMTSANEAMISILMSRIIKRDWQSYHLLNNTYPRDSRVQLDENNIELTVPPQIWDVIQRFGMLVLAASGSGDMQRAIKVAETLLDQTQIARSVYKIAVGVMVTADGHAMIEILLSTVKPQPQVQTPRPLGWLRELGSSGGGGGSSTGNLQLHSSL